MTFFWFKNMESTQTFLLDLLKDSIESSDFDSLQMPLNTPLIAICQNQTKGIGSRGNKWEKVECGLYFSCALHKTLLPNDVPPQSLSIYFGMIFLEIFAKFNANVWLKWPNDFYISNSQNRESKIGGIITQIYKDFVIFGIGLNIFSTKYYALFESMESNKLENLYFIIQEILNLLMFENTKFDINGKKEILICDKKCDTFLQIPWDEVFRKYKTEFSAHRDFSAHILDSNGEYKKIHLKNCTLQNDGSLKYKDKILYSLR